MSFQLLYTKDTKKKIKESTDLQNIFGNTSIKVFIYAFCVESCNAKFVKMQLKLFP